MLLTFLRSAIRFKRALSVLLLGPFRVIEGDLGLGRDADLDRDLDLDGDADLGSGRSVGVSYTY